VFVVWLTVMLPRADSSGVSVAWTSAAVTKESRYERVKIGSIASSVLRFSMLSILMMPYSFSTATRPRLLRIALSATSHG